MMGLALGFRPFQRSYVGASPVQRSYQGTGRLQIAAAAISIAKPTNFNFIPNTLSNGTSKIALGIQCHVNCLGGSQILLQRKNGLFKSRRYISVVKEKQGRCGVASCHLAGGASPALPSPTVYDASLGPKLRAIVFYVVNCIVAIPLFVVMLAAHPFVLLFDRYRRKFHHLINKECLKRCLNVLKHGASVHFFPEGTRPKDGKLTTFKKGAFSMAAKARVPVVPITLIGTGKIMPNGMEGTMRPGSIKIIVNQPIEGKNADELNNKARSVIAEQLDLYGDGVH